ncbi:MAG: hypothetical protein PCFJNLEI_03280 [Verrucomicrobiae bacterium]|nr:hypothetical protein [Verrucomicrobiae bacterium]
MAQVTLHKARRVLRVCLVFAVLYIGYRLTLRWMIEAKLSEIRKQGCPVTLAELNSWYSTAPLTANVASEYMRAFARCNRSWGTNTLSQSALAVTNSWPYWIGQVWMQRQLLPVIGMLTLPASGPPLPRALRQPLAEYISDYQETLGMLHSVPPTAGCRYPIDFRRWFEDENDHLTSLRCCADLLRLEIVNGVENGDVQSTVDSFAALGTLARSLKDEPRDLSVHVRAHVEEDAVYTLQRALNRLVFRDTQLSELDAVLKQLEADEQIRPAIVGQRCMANEAYRTDPWLMKTVITNLSSPPRRTRSSELPFWGRAFNTALRVSGLVDMDWLMYLRVTEMNLTAAELPFPQRLEQIEDSKPGIVYGLTHYFSRILFNEQHWMVQREARTASWIRCARAALAIERRRIATGELPSLSAEIPSQLFAESDPFTGRPLRFKKLATGYTVYSIGRDAVDDGGDGKKDITFTVER